MTLVYGHRPHMAENRATHREYRWDRDVIHDVPEDFARAVTEANPERLCLIPDDVLYPAQHRCRITRQLEKEDEEREESKEYAHTQVEEPAVDRQMKPGRMAAGRRKLVRQARKRSMIARRETAEI